MQGSIRPRLIFASFALIVSGREFNNVRILICLILSIFKHNCAGANSKQGETVCELRRTKTRRGVNNPVYNKFVC